MRRKKKIITQSTLVNLKSSSLLPRQKSDFAGGWEHQ
jgi:chromatin segregation and condensation protein Rec8/ScpA/Scc1 (kleisin family)